MKLQECFRELNTGEWVDAHVPLYAKYFEMQEGEDGIRTYSFIRRLESSTGILDYNIAVRDGHPSEDGTSPMRRVSTLRMRLIAWKGAFCPANALYTAISDIIRR